MHNDSSPQHHAWHDGLEVLRGMAALAVMLFHALPVFGLMIPGTPLRLASAGWIGVDVFFAISGYVITASALRGSTPPDYGSLFWRARLARILPLYYVTSVVFVLLFPPGAVQQNGMFQLVTHTLLIHNLFPQTATSINGVTWSLGVEMQLYVVAFFVVPLVATWPRKKLVAGYVLLLCGVLAYRFAMWKILRDAGETDATISNAVTQVPGLLDSFAFGGLVFLWGPVQHDRRRAIAFVLLACLLYLLIFHIYDTNAANYWRLLSMTVFFRTLVALFAGVLLIGVLSSSPKKSGAWSPFLFLGRISYGIYLWHLIALYTAETHFRFFPTGNLVGMVALTLTLATASHYLVERPVMRWARHRAVKKSLAPAA